MNRVIYCDGGGFNGKTSLVGVYADGRCESWIFSAYRHELTNNEAEYIAMIHALISCTHGDTILSDSLLVVNQLNGSYQVKKETLRHLYDIAKRLLAKKEAKIEYVKREQNKAGIMLEGIRKNELKD